MKSYTITVNGSVYDVTVEEKGEGSVSAPAAPRKAPDMHAAAQKPSAAAPAPAAGGEGSIRIEAGAAGKVFKVESAVGAKVKMGQTVLVLEIMKMETPVVAPKDGTVASIHVSEGQSVEAGALLATLSE